MMWMLALKYWPGFLARKKWLCQGACGRSAMPRLVV